MSKEISALVEEGILTPVADLTTIKDDDPDNGPFKEDLVMQHVPDAPTRGHTSHTSKANSGRLTKLQARANLSKYIVFPKYMAPFKPTLLTEFRSFLTTSRPVTTPITMMYGAHSGYYTKTNILRPKCQPPHPWGTPQSRRPTLLGRRCA